MHAPVERPRVRENEESRQANPRGDQIRQNTSRGRLTRFRKDQL